MKQEMTKEEVIEARKSLNMTQADFAHLVTVRVGTVSRWENGHKSPNQLAVYRIKQILKDKEEAKECW